MLPLDEVVHPDHPVSEAVERMRETGFGMLPVVDGDEIVGIVCMQDLQRDAADAFAPGTAVRDEMRAEILYCFADDSLSKAADAMKSAASAECLVVDGEKRLAGHVTLEATLEDTQHPEGGESGGLAERRRPGGGRKRGNDPHEVKSFSQRPYIRD